MDITPQGRSFDDQRPHVVDSLCRSWLSEARASGLEGVCVARTVNGAIAGEVFRTDDLSSQLMSLHALLGEGPALQVMADRGPVLISDLSSDALGARWVTFAREAQAVGAASYYVLPLQIGVVQLGVLAVHGTAPAELDQSGMAGLLRLADVLALTLLAQNDADLLLGADSGHLLPVSDALCHQAAGMVMAQVDGTIDAALMLIRSHAFGTGQSLRDVSRLIVDRQLRFGDGRGSFLPESGDDND